MTRLQSDLEKNLKQIEKSELVQNVLNYKMYELQYNFMTKIQQIGDRRKELEAADSRESAVALEIVELDKELAECENAHDASFQVKKIQKLVSFVQLLFQLMRILLMARNSRRQFFYFLIGVYRVFVQAYTSENNL